MSGLLKRSCLSALLVLAVCLVAGAPAMAGSAWWGLTSGSWPSNLPPGGTGKVIVTVQNRGYTDAESLLGEPIVVRDVLPESLTAKSVEAFSGENEGGGAYHGSLKCSLPSVHEVKCTFLEGARPGEAALVPPFEEIEERIKVVVSNEASASEENTFSVSGGNLPGKDMARHIAVGEETRFGVENYELMAEEEGGEIASQAGEHPFQLTSVLDINTSTVASEVSHQQPAAMLKDVSFRLPPGLIGNPTPFDQCTDALFIKQECPPQSAVGVSAPTFDAPKATALDTSITNVYNMVPLPGEPARFAFDAGGVPVYLNTAVRTGGDYGVTVNVKNLSEVPGVLVSKVTFWGVPGEAAHNAQRGFACLTHAGECSNVIVKSPPPLLSLPTVCDGPMSTSVQAESWAEPHPAAPMVAPLFVESTMGGLFGCNHLQFDPEISVEPDVPNAATPTGLAVTVHVSQTSALFPEGLAESALKDTTVVLPAGVAVNPGGADGLEACSESQVGYLGKTAGEPAENLFTPIVGNPFCSDASKIGTVEIETPLLPHVLKGAVYLAAQNENPFGSLIALYMIAEEPVSGTILKLTGEVALNADNGQLVTTFKDTPELPFENLRLHFFGESRAPLGTPPLCGSYTTQAVFSPWSGNAPSNVSSKFAITSGPNGGPCPNAPGVESLAALPFAPTLTAGSTNIQTGAFSAFTTTMSREDGNQNLKAIQLHMPPGLLGTLSSVKLCGEPQADTGTCSPESLIGETTVSVGLGNNPYTVTGGKIYITGPYQGAPYGLSIVNPAKAGPFDLGQVIVRAKIEVDPITAALTVTTDTTGPFAIPQMIDGIPLQIKHVNVQINRPNFTFNPTNCAPMKIAGSLTSSQDAVSSLSVPFQVTNCATLAFKPRFGVSTSGKTSRAKGASLHVKLAYPIAAWGSQANIKSVHVELPKALPSRLTTLNHACLDSVFNQNPADCPSQSRVGFAKAVTPIVPVPLEGPAYFVSHGGQKFPELIVVLQGYGATVYLQGETFISKAGITSSTFKSVPDVPVGSFELTLPQGPFSALAANTDLCTASLVMPNTFDAQNGATLKQSTSIEVQGCPYALRIVHRAVKKRTLTLKVSVPVAGKLVASGKGVSRGAKMAKGRSTLTVTLKEGHAGKLRTKVLLRFTPAKGKQRKVLRKTLVVTFR